MKKVIAIVVGLFMLLMLSGVALSADPAAPAPAPAKAEPEKQKPAKVTKAGKHHLKKVELTTGKYVSVSGGVVFRQDSDVDDLTVSVDDGFAFSVAAGKRLNAMNKAVRVEAELGYQKNDIDEYCKGRCKDASDSSNIKAYTMLVNGYYDFVKGKKIVPYVTAGIGLAKVDADVDLNVAHVDNWGIAYQVGAGVAYHINDNWHIDLKYRYLGVTDLNGIEFDKMNPDFTTNNIILGLRYRF